MREGFVCAAALQRELTADEEGLVAVARELAHTRGELRRSERGSAAIAIAAERAQVGARAIHHYSQLLVTYLQTYTPSLCRRLCATSLKLNLRWRLLSVAGQRHRPRYSLLSSDRLIDHLSRRLPPFRHHSSLCRS